MIYMINIIDFFYKIIFVLNTFNIIFIELIKYSIIKDYKKFILNIADKLSNKNKFYVKILQAISTNNELFTQDINNCLLKYTNNVDFTDKDYNYNHIINSIDFINEYYNNYTIDKESLKQINSGMISIVFKGKMNKRFLNNDGNYEYIKNDIVIKLLRNDIKKHIINSFNNVEFLIKILNFIPKIKYLNILDIIEQSKDTILLQTDFTNEIKNIRLFKNKNKNIDYIVVPEPYEIFTNYNKNIIVMDYIDGRGINQINNEEKNIYLLQLAKFGIKSILYDGLYHGDIHPGNILFVNDKNEKNNRYNGLKIGVIDYGIISSITEDEQLLYFNFFTLMFENKYYELSNIILNNFTEPNNNLNTLSNIEKNDIINHLEKIARNALIKNKTFSPNDIMKINKIFSYFDIKVSKKFSNVLLSIGISDSVSKQLESNIKYIDTVKIAVEEIMKSIKI